MIRRMEHKNLELPQLQNLDGSGSQAKRQKANDMAMALAGASAPHLGMPEPQSARSALVSGSLSLLAHGVLLGALVIFAWLNPDIVEKVIPVTIVKEAPGSNEEPAPVRRGFFV